MEEKRPKMSPWIEAEEGLFVNDHRDPGGATKYGITLRTLNAWRKRLVTVADVKARTWADAAQIIHTQYFLAVHGAALPAGLDCAVTDAAVSSGPVQAIKWLQKSLGVKADGHWGFVTEHAVQSLRGIDAEIDAFDAPRLGFMRRLRTWSVFGKGWFGRVNRATARSKSLVLANDNRPKLATTAAA